VEFHLLSPVNTSIAIETSLDLIRWQLWQVVTNRTGDYVAQDLNFLLVPQRFYRAVITNQPTVGSP
jgi:hypothetical protein